MIIRVYTGSGASVYGAPILIGELQKHMPLATVASITEEEMKGSRDWEHQTSLLIFAGKSVGAFKAALGPQTLDKIQRGVFEGAFDYAGICAGAAFAGAEIYYRMWAQNPKGEQWISNTGLSFFNGLAVGPIKPVSSAPFHGGSEDLKLIKVRSLSDGTVYNSVYWGGPALVPFGRDNSACKILTQLEGTDVPLSMMIHYGLGKVHLCSHHPEINGENITRWADARMIAALEADRIQLIAAQLDDNAFRVFLKDAGLISKDTSIMPIKKAANLMATFPS